jgi:hypothetical protein
MAKCEVCGARILFGPVRQGAREYCSNGCRDKGLAATAAAELPAGFVFEKAREAASSPCVHCGGDGPIDVHHAHWVWSALAFSRFNTTTKICCGRCGRRERFKAIAFNSLLGWWGFPWGVFGTPAQILRNLSGPKASRDGEPSREMVALVEQSLAAQLMNSPRQG